MNALSLSQAGSPRVWNAFGYTRISKDDRDRSESNSIKNQRDMVLDFANLTVKSSRKANECPAQK